MNCDILKIVRGNDFATQMTITALDAGGNVIEDFSLEDSTDVVVKYTLAGESHTIEAYDYDIEGNDITIQWSDLALGKYGFEIEGKFNGYSWRSAARFIFQIVADNASANIPDGVLVNGIYILNDWLRLLSGTGGGGKQVQADWTETDTNSPAYIQNKPDLSPVATSGSYNDLTDKPTIPDVSGKADKVSGAVAGDFAALDANGNLTDSGKKASDFATAAQGAKADTAIQDISGKQDVLVSGTNIKTINNQSILGSGDIEIGGAVDSVNGKTGVVVLDAEDVGAASAAQVQSVANDVATNTQDIAALQAAYEGLTQSDIVIGALPSSGVANTIYRVPSTSSYSDYMWDGSQFVLMATYDNAIDDVPTAGSNNLVKSGGVYDAVDNARITLKSEDVYINGEINTARNMYVTNTSSTPKVELGTPANRAKAMPSSIIKIPEGATSVTYKIGNKAFSNGRYKIGWGQYTSNFVQISATVGGWFTSATTQTQSINANGKYVMFYFAAVENSGTVDVNNLVLDDFSIVFNNSSEDYGVTLAHPRISDIYPKLVEETDFYNNKKCYVNFPQSEIYECGAVSPDGNTYDIYPENSSLQRARVKKEMLQEIPSGAKGAIFKIKSSAFANGKYKIGWAQYTSNYQQISSTVKGWYTTEQFIGVEINNNAKYFMFYYSTVSDSDTVDVNTLPLEGSFEVYFDDNTYNYAKEICSKPLSFVYPNIISPKYADIKSNVDFLKLNPQEYNIFSINHRGYSELAPENTTPAFVLSKKKGFYYVESDVQFTSDNVPVMLHDTTINRTARNADGSAISGTIYLQNITYEQALTYDFGIWKGEEFAGTKILSFEDFIILCKKAVLHPFIELKDTASGTIWTDTRIEIVANIIKKYGMSENVSFISFNLSALQKISAIFPKASLGLGYNDTYSSGGLATILTSAQSIKTDNNIVYVTLNYEEMTTSLYEQVVDAGISPIVWTVNTQEDILSLSDYVVGVMSDIYNVGQIILEDVLN